MAVLKKAEFEKELKEAIGKTTKLLCDIKLVKQFIRLTSPTTIEFTGQIEINGEVENLPSVDLS